MASRRAAGGTCRSGGKVAVLPAFNVTLNGTAGPGANSPGGSAMGGTAAPCIVTTSLGWKMPVSGAYSNWACTDQKSPMTKKLKAWAAAIGATWPDERKRGAQTGVEWD